MKLKIQIVPNREEITNDMTIAHIAINYKPPSWEKVFEDAIAELEDVSEIIEERKKEARIVPDFKDLFNCFWMTPLNKVKVVLCAQDPYFVCFT